MNQFKKSKKTHGRVKSKIPATVKFRLEPTLQALNIENLQKHDMQEPQFKNKELIQRYIHEMYDKKKNVEPVSKFIQAVQENDSITEAEIIELYKKHNIMDSVQQD